MDKFTNEIADMLRENNIVIKQTKTYYENWVSTIFAADTKKYETGVRDIRYSNYIIIVEEYNNLESAVKGHHKWYSILTDNKPPEQLINVSTSQYCHHGFGKIFSIKQ